MRLKPPMEKKDNLVSIIIGETLLVPLSIGLLMAEFATELFRLWDKSPYVIFPLMTILFGINQLLYRLGIIKVKKVVL